jgi:hypothetical protein
VRSAVLLLVFRRPETTRRVMRAIAQAKPPRIYIASDGPRPGRSDDSSLSAEVRRITTDVTWPCEVRTLFRDRNLGCRAAVSGGIDWFFEHEMEGVILEDDCVPDSTFFAYADGLLERFRHDDRIAMISGDDFHPPGHAREHSYSFTRYPYVWGWATWRSAWSTYDTRMLDWPQLRRTDWLERLGDGYPDFARYWRERFDDVYEGRTDTWDYVWTYSVWRNELLSIMPTTHLVSNVGFGSGATHTSRPDWRSALDAHPMPFPLRHPPHVARDPAVDRWADLHVYGTQSAAWRRLARRVPGARPFASWLRRRLG